MAGPYYCDLAADFVDRSGADATTNVLTGPGGCQAAITGAGNATALVAGDTLWVKGTATLARFVNLTCGKDVTAWSVGDTVVDNNTGSEWSGKVCETNYASTATIIRVQLNSSYEQNDITLANGINNTTAADTTTLSVKSCIGIQFNTNSGTYAAYIRIRGTSDLTDPANNLAQAVFECDSVGTNATQAILVNVSRHSFEYLTFQNAASDGTERSSLALSTFYHCLSKDNAGHGFDLYNNGSRMYRCIARDNGLDGFSQPYGTGSFVYCVASGNTSEGINVYPTSPVIGCLSYENGGDNFYFRSSTSARSIMVNCVADGSTGGSGILVQEDRMIIVGCRCTNNNQYGIERGGTDRDEIDDFNVCYGNGVGARLNVPAGPNSNDSPVDDGYVSAATDDYNVKAGAEIRSTALVLDWDV